MEMMEINSPPPAPPEPTVTEDFMSYFKTNESGTDQYVTATLTPSGVEIKDPDTNMVKNLSYQTFIKKLSDNNTLDTGIMPAIVSEGVFIRRYLTSGNKHILLIEHLPKVRTITYQRYSEEDEIEYKIPFPPLIFAAVLKEKEDGSLKFNKDASRMYAMKTQLFGENTDLCKYPFTNVYADNRVCWGSALEYLQNTDLKIGQTAGILLSFMNSIHNNDLFDPSHTHLKDSNEIREVFESLNNQESYPVDTLERTMSLNEAVSLLMNN